MPLVYLLLESFLIFWSIPVVTCMNHYHSLLYAYLIACIFTIVCVTDHQSINASQRITNQVTEESQLNTGIRQFLNIVVTHIIANVQLYLII